MVCVAFTSLSCAWLSQDQGQQTSMLPESSAFDLGRQASYSEMSFLDAGWPPEGGD